ncbi:hypothetical protein HYV50_05580 [Candidatus Pacearchaeota archaeon]|nr:hypothetical protein [Candidatus Pacearchaeota archaeon]
MKNHPLIFKTSGNSYNIISYIDAKRVNVSGNASAEQTDNIFFVRHYGKVIGDYIYFDEASEILGYNYTNVPINGSVYFGSNPDETKDIFEFTTSRNRYSIVGFSGGTTKFVNLKNNATGEAPFDEFTIERNGTLKSVT